MVPGSSRHGRVLKDSGGTNCAYSAVEVPFGAPNFSLSVEGTGGRDNKKVDSIASGIIPHTDEGNENR